MNLPRYKRLVAFVFMAVSGITGLCATADRPAIPFSYTRTTNDGQFVFAMIAPEKEGDHSPELRDSYPQSGLYRNDGSAIPLWTVDWYTYDVVPVSDGIHLVCPGPWPMRYDDPAVSFYADGKLIREYKINELVSFPRLMPHSVSHFSWSKEEHMDDAAKTYTITTRHLERYVFDVTTGEIVSSFSPFTILSALGIAGLVWGVVVWRRARPKRVETRTS